MMQDRIGMTPEDEDKMTKEFVKVFQQTKTFFWIVTGVVVVVFLVFAMLVGGAMYLGIEALRDAN